MGFSSPLTDYDGSNSIDEKDYDGADLQLNDDGYEWQWCVFVGFQKFNGCLRFKNKIVGNFK